MLPNTSCTQRCVLWVIVDLTIFTLHMRNKSMVRVAVLIPLRWWAPLYLKRTYETYLNWVYVILNFLFSFLKGKTLCFVSLSTLKLFKTTQQLIRTCDRHLRWRKTLTKRFFVCQATSPWRVALVLYFVVLIFTES